MKKINPFSMEGTPRERGDAMIAGLKKIHKQEHYPFEQRARAGDVVRLFGYPGLYSVREVCKVTASRWLVIVLPEGEMNHWKAFKVTDAGVVEVNGEPVPLLSVPVGYPAHDYPHELADWWPPREAFDRHAMGHLYEGYCRRWQAQPWFLGDYGEARKA